VPCIPTLRAGHDVKAQSPPPAVSAARADPGDDLAARGIGRARAKVPATVISTLDARV